MLESQYGGGGLLRRRRPSLSPIRQAAMASLQPLGADPTAAVAQLRPPIQPSASNRGNPPVPTPGYQGGGGGPAQIEPPPPWPLRKTPNPTRMGRRPPLAPAGLGQIALARRRPRKPMYGYDGAGGAL